MDPEVAKLICLIEKWIKLLRHYHGDNEWVTWLEKDVQYLRDSDFYGIEHLRSAFGGMGSITDFALVGERGAWFGRMRARFINKRYSCLVSRIYDLADRLFREHVRNNGCT